MVVGLAEVVVVTAVTPPDPEPVEVSDDPESDVWPEEPELLLPPPHADNDAARTRPATA
jgi:hypothetical protein